MARSARKPTGCNVFGLFPQTEKDPPMWCWRFVMSSLGLSSASFGLRGEGLALELLCDITPHVTRMTPHSLCIAMQLFEENTQYPGREDPEVRCAWTEVPRAALCAARHCRW